MIAPLLISFYTKNTIYEKEIADLIASCKSLEIEYCIQAREDLGSWDRNCCQKPLFILECMEKYNRPLLWVDADAVVMQKIALNYDNVDLALYFNNRSTNDARSATIYIAPTVFAKAFISQWYEHCLEALSKGAPVPYADQSVLVDLLRTSPVLKIADLPLEYTSIFDRDPLPMSKIRILHFQASRTALIPKVLWENISGAQLKAMRMDASIAKRSLNHVD